jgi:hypothetical protein
MSLDDDLAAWAAAVRLPDADAGVIFQRIVASAADPSAAADRSAAPADAAVVVAAAPRLDASWWRGYNAGFAARMVASTAPVRLAA